MRSTKIVAIVLLVLFAITLPITLLSLNVSRVLFNQEKVTELLVTNLLSDEALPQLIKEITILETLHGEMDKSFDVRMLVNVLGGIHSEQWLELFATVFPEDQRIGLAEDVVGGLFNWLGNDQPYPDIVIPVGKILENVDNNLVQVTTWIFSAFRVPPCDSGQIARYQAGDFGDDPQALITCTPPPEMKEAVIAATALVIRDTLAEEAPPSKIVLADQLSAQMSAEEMLSQKVQANTARTLTRWLWLLPIIFFIIALALTVRSLNDLIDWVQWPFLTTGVLGVLLALRVGNPEPLLRNALLPAPEAVIPPPVVAVLIRIANGLFSQVSASMLWQTLPLLIVGVAMLAYTYRHMLKTIPASLMSVFRSFTHASLETSA